MTMPTDPTPRAPTREEMLALVAAWKGEPGQSCPEEAGGAMAEALRALAAQPAPVTRDEKAGGPEAEPVAWMYVNLADDLSYCERTRREDLTQAGWTETALYTAKALASARAEGERGEREACARIAALEADLTQIASDRDRLAEREAYFAARLGIADSGQYRADWDAKLEEAAAALAQVSDLRRRLGEAVEALRPFAVCAANLVPSLAEIRIEVTPEGEPRTALITPTIAALRRAAAVADAGGAG